MKFFRYVKSFLLKIDIFGSSEMLRYKGEGKYQTMTGGTITLALIIIFSIVTLQSFSSVVNKAVVSATDATYFLDDPTYTSFQISESKFIFGIGVSNYNLNSGPRYFDIDLISMSYRNGKKTSEIYHDLQPCLQSQWSRINDVGLNSFHKIQLNKFLCPKPAQIMEFQGKYTSQSFKILKIKVSKCKNQTDPSRPCVSDDVIKTVPSYNLNFYFMNAYVNSGNLQPVDYYLEDRNYFPFNINATVVNNIYFSQHIIKTDNSLLPNENVESQTILMVKDLAEVKSSANFINQYININLRKSPEYVESTRTFTKFDQLFSYIGGLFGFAISFFFILSFYTQTSYEVQMGNRLFFYNNVNPLEPGKFNFLTYIGFTFYYLLRKINIQIPWKKMEQYYDCKQEVSEQLDLGLLMNKITFLEKCMNILFEEHQFRAIYLQQKPTVSQAQILRLNHGLNKILHKNSKLINTRIPKKSKTEVPKISNQKNMLNSDCHVIYRSENVFCQSTHKAEQKQKEVAESNYDEPLPSDIVELVRDFIFKKGQQDSQSSEGNQEQEINKGNIGKILQTRQMGDNFDKIDNFNEDYLEEVPAKHISGLKYINTAMSDIKKIERQAKLGNMISRRIYERLNNQITEEQFVVLKCLQRLSNRRIGADSQQKNKKSDEMNDKPQGFFSRIINIAGRKEQKTQYKEKAPGGLEIALDTNDRIERSFNF